MISETQKGLKSLFGTVKKLQKQYGPKIRTLCSDEHEFSFMSFGDRIEYRAATSLQRESFRIYTQDDIRILSLYNIYTYHISDIKDGKRVNINTANNIKIYLDFINNP